MPISTDINLVKGTNELPDFIGPLQSQYRNFSILVLLVVSAATALTLVLYTTIRVRHELLDRSKQSLTKQLAQEKVKENLFLVIRSRISVVDKVLALAYPISGLLSDATTIAQPPKLKSLSMISQDAVKLSFSADSIEDALSMMVSVITLKNNNRIKSVMLENFSIGYQGINLSISFKPVW